MRLTTREHHPGVGHTSQHSIAERVEVDFVRAGAVEYQLSQGVCSSPSFCLSNGFHQAVAIMKHMDEAHEAMGM